MVERNQKKNTLSCHVKITYIQILTPIKKVFLERHHTCSLSIADGYFYAASASRGVVTRQLACKVKNTLSDSLEKKFCQL